MVPFSRLASRGIEIFQQPSAVLADPSLAEDESLADVGAVARIAPGRWLDDRRVGVERGWVAIIRHLRILRSGGVRSSGALVVFSRSRYLTSPQHRGAIIPSPQQDRPASQAGDRAFAQANLDHRAGRDAGVAVVTHHRHPLGQILNFFPQFQQW